MMLNYSEGEVTIEGIKTHYYRTGGRKPPFLLLHGATDNGLCWTPTAEKLVINYDVIMVDAQGHGLSDRLNKNFKPENHAIHVAGLVNELKLTKPIIMGHSMGAGTTVHIAVNYPDLPKAIVLEDPAWQRQDEIDAEEMRRHHEEITKEMAEYRKLSRDELIAKCRKNNPAWSDDEIIPWAAAKHQFDPSLFSALRVDRLSYKELVPKIDCPTQLIIAESGLVSVKTAEHAAQLWKSKYPFRWLYVKGAGHNIRREQPNVFWDTLSDFLQSIGK